MITLLPLIYGLLIAYFIYTFEPLQAFLENQSLAYFNKHTFNDNNIKHIAIDMFMSIITCPYCLAFWITLIISFNFFSAVIAVIIMKLIKKYLPFLL